MDQLVGFLLHPPLSEIGKKIGKMLKYTPTFKVLSAPLPTHTHTHLHTVPTHYACLLMAITKHTHSPTL